MKPLSSQNIEAELSYAYIHAVAAQCGMACTVGSRHEDNAGIDARITAWSPFENGGYLDEVTINIQLKATIKPRTIVHNDYYAYSLQGIAQYNDLRVPSVATPRILVILFLPPDQTNWLSHSENALTLSHCAYWVSLRDAPESSNQTSQTIHIPKQHTFDPMGLKSLVAQLSRREIPCYGVHQS